jgi:hypothetical protein
LHIDNFLKDKLKLILHPNKVTIRTLNSGQDFLGWVNFFDYRTIRTITRRKMLRSIKENPTKETINSYLGLLGHGNTLKIQSGFPLSRE